MASVYKRTKYAPVPAHAVIVEVPIKNGMARRIARWTDAHGADQQADVEFDKCYGNRIVIGEFKNWYISYESEYGRKQIKGFADKAASIKRGQDLERDAARRRVGLIDQCDDYSKTPLDKHLNDFIATRPTHASSQLYVDQVRHRIERIVKGIGASRLHELDPVAVDRFLNVEKIVGHTRNEYVGNIKAFTRWAVESKRLRDDPLVSLRKTPRQKIFAVHPRRALSPHDVAKLLDAALRRPLLEKMIVRTGENTGRAVGKVHPRVQAKMERLGRERWLCYMIAVWAGLRRAEIEHLQWGDIHLDTSAPHIELRAVTTKAKRADVLSLHPQLAQALREAKSTTAKPSDSVVKSVPDMKAFRADLKLAGIDAGDHERGFIDFHCLRKTLSTMMASAGMSQRTRQSHMRHTDPRLTENTYMDERLLPIAEELAAVPPIPLLGTASTASVAAKEKSVPGAAPGAAGAAPLHRKAAILTLDLTPADYTGQEEIVELIIRGPRSQVQQIQRVGEALAPDDKPRHPAAPGQI